MCADPKLCLTKGQLHATLKPFSTGLSEDWVGRSYLLKFFKAISLALLIVTGGPSMAFGGSLVLASALEGRLLDGEGGHPVSGVTIKRNWSWAWTNREGSDETVTDSEGRFQFQEVVGRSLTAKFVPHEPNVRQEITAELPGGSLTLLSLQKSNYETNGELGGKPLRIACRTDLEPDARGFFWGTCEYDP
jgi:hypothetical protein